MPDTCSAALNPHSRASAVTSSGVKKLTNGVPDAAAPFEEISRPGRSAGSSSSAGSRKDIAKTDPGASPATCRSVTALASFDRYMDTPVETMTAGRRGSNPAADSCFSQASPVSKSVGTSRSHSGTP